MRLTRWLAPLSPLVLTACLLDAGDNGYDMPDTKFDFSALDALPSPLARWYDVPAGKSLASVIFAFRSLDYAQQADSNIAAFAEVTGAKPAVAGAYVDLRVNPVRLRAFLDAVAAQGVVPYVTFDPKDFAGQNEGAEYGYLAQIAQGTWDAKLKEVAGVLRDFNRPVLLRWAHEMNGNWYPYSGTFTGGGHDSDGDGIADGPQKYIAAWRYVHALFLKEEGAAEGASRIAWVYSPNAESFPNAAWNQPYSYYPGSDYVDLIAVDVYEHPEQGFRRLSSLLAPVFNDLGLFLEKHAGDPAYALRPFGLAEFGTSRTKSSDKGDWYADAFDAVSLDTRIRMHTVYNARNGDKDFSIGGLGERLKPHTLDDRFVFGPLPIRSQPLTNPLPKVASAAPSP